MKNLINKEIYLNHPLITRELLNSLDTIVDDYNLQKLYEWDEIKKNFPWWEKPFSNIYYWSFKKKQLITRIRTYDDLFGPPAYDVILYYLGKKYRFLAANRYGIWDTYLDPQEIWYKIIIVPYEDQYLY